MLALLACLLLHTQELQNVLNSTRRSVWEVEKWPRGFLRNRPTNLIGFLFRPPTEQIISEIKPSVQAHILRMLNIVTWLAGLGEKRAKRWHFRKNSIFCVWRFHPQMKNFKTLGLNVHWIGWKMLSTNQIAPFSGTCHAETLGLIWSMTSN